MTGGPIEFLDDDVFYDPTTFGVVATVAGASEEGLFDEQEIENDDRLALRPVFRCRARFDEGTVVTILEVDYTVEAVQPLETGEHGHILRKNDP